MHDRALYSIQEARKLPRWHFPEHDLPAPSDGRARQRPDWLPTLHFPRRDCRAHRQVDHDHQPLARLHTIAPGGPSRTPPAATHLASKPDGARSELISCPWLPSADATTRSARDIHSLHLRPGITGRQDRASWIQHAPRAAGAACAGKELG